MLMNWIFILLLLAAAVLFGWLAVRSARSTGQPVLKWAGAVLAGLVALVLLIVGGVAARGAIIFSSPRNASLYPVTELQVAGTPEQIARGEHLATTTCAACHNAQGQLPLSGGINLSEDTGLPLGDLYPPNLTPAGDLPNWTDGEIMRAMRTATHASGRPLAIMPWQRLRNLSDEDAQAIIAYLRSQPAVENDVPKVTPSLLALAMTGANMLSLAAEPAMESVSAPPAGPTYEYGEYIVSFSDCRDCHGENLDGVVAPPAPPGPNLALVNDWTAEEFITTIRTGVDPTGHEIQPPMPWKAYSNFTDDELTAIYLYLTQRPVAAAE
jgi:mono/diheme cytochrome c family protein